MKNKRIYKKSLSCSKNLMDLVEKYAVKWGVSWSRAVELLCIYGDEHVRYINSVENRINEIDEHEEKRCDIKTLDNSMKLW